MAGRFTPSIFDKLTGASTGRPDGGAAESADQRVFRFGERSARQALRRDLSWLFNTAHLAASVDLSDLPEVERSVLNYGIPDLAGRAVNRRELEQRARDLRGAIRVFETRLDPSTLDVEVVSQGSDSEGKITFVVRSDLVSPIEPLAVQFKTQVEVDTGSASVGD